MSAASTTGWAWPTRHSLLQRLRTSEAKRQQAGTLAPPPVLAHMLPFAPVRFSSCQWVTDAAPPWPRCGAPTDGGCAWCSEHRLIVFQPREVRPMR